MYHLDLNVRSSFISITCVSSQIGVNLSATPVWSTPLNGVDQLGQEFSLCCKTPGHVERSWEVTIDDRKRHVYRFGFYLFLFPFLFTNRFPLSFRHVSFKPLISSAHTQEFSCGLSGQLIHLNYC